MVKAHCQGDWSDMYKGGGQHHPVDARTMRSSYNLSTEEKGSIVHVADLHNLKYPLIGNLSNEIWTIQSWEPMYLGFACGYT